MYPLVAEPRLVEAAGHRRPQGVGPPPGRVGLVAGGHVGRAHRAVQGLAARADAAAHLDRAPQAPERRVVEVALRLRGAVLGAVAQVGGEGRRVDDLAGVEQPRRVERALDGAERLVELGAEHPRHERGAHQPVAVLAREGAAVLEHQLGDVVGDGLELAHPRLGLHVDDGAHVQAAHRGVGVDAGGAAVALHDVEEPGDVVAQARRGDRGVLDEGDALGVALHRHRQPQRRLPQAPDAGLGGGVDGPRRAARDAPAGEVLLDGLEPARQLGRVVGVELHAEQRAGRLVALQHRPPQRVEGRALAGVVEDEAVHHLDRRRPVLEDGGGGPEGIEQVVELEGEHRLGVGQGHQVHPRLDHEAEGALRADDQLGEVERPRGVGETVEVVAPDPAQDLRVPAVDLGRVGRRQLAHRPVAGALEGVGRAGRLELVRGERAQVGDGPVAERHVQVEHVIDGLAVQHRARPARVVADHAADGGPVGGRDVGGEAQPVRREVRVQLVEDDAGLDARPPLLGVHLEHAVEEPRRVELQPLADGLARLRGAAAARGDRHPVPARDLDGAQHVVAVADDHHAGGLDLVDAGVGRVERAADAVEAHLAVDARLQIALQVGHGGSISLAASPTDPSARGDGALPRGRGSAAWRGAARSPARHGQTANPDEVREPCLHGNDRRGNAAGPSRAQGRAAPASG